MLTHAAAVGSDTDFGSYFQTKTLPRLGTFQDGGVRANSPLAIALREASVVWPSSGFDLLLSVGTGFSRSAVLPRSGLLGRLAQGAAPRLWRAMMTSPCMDGRQGFAEAMNHHPRQQHHNIIRLDQAIDGPLPALDDVSALDGFALMNFSIDDEVVRKVLARGLFFFELDDTPVPTHAGFSCRGSVFCSRPEAAGILGRVAIEFPGARLQIGHSHNLGCLGVDDCCPRCGHFRKCISFAVTSLEEKFSIEVANNDHCEMIGGFPKSAAELLREQRAFASFGRADHQDLGWPRIRSCRCSSRKKRRISILEPLLVNKKPRL